MTFKYLADFFVTLGIWGMMALSFWGWGVFFSGKTIAFKGSDKTFMNTWLGLSLFLFYLQVWHLFLPVGFWSGFIFLTLGLIFCARALGVKKIRFSGSGWKNCVYMLLWGLVVLFIVAQSMPSPANSDSGLYHFNSIRWSTIYPIVPGLGNLHSRLAFNQSFFLFVGALDFYPYMLHGYNLANGFFAALAFSTFYWGLVTDSRFYAADELFEKGAVWLCLCFMPVLLHMGMFGGFSSPTPDIASNMLQMVLFVFFTRLVTGEVKPENMVSALAFILITGAAMITVKLSNAVFAVLMVFLSFARCLPALKHSFSLRLVPVAALPILMLLVWAARSVILSGYPFYPSTFLRFPVDWAMSHDSVVDIANWIYSWARAPFKHWSEVLGNWNWFIPWLRIFLLKPQLAHLLHVGIFAGIISLALRFFQGRIKFSVKSTGVYLWLPCLGGLLFWFLSAPDPRFALALFWITVVVSLYRLLGALSQFSMSSRRLLYVLLFCVLHLVTFRDLYVYSKGRIRISPEGYGNIPVSEMVEVKTGNGFSIFYPEEGEACWDSKLPSIPGTAYLRPDLRMRGRDLSFGFTVQKSDSLAGKTEPEKGAAL